MEYGAVLVWWVAYAALAVAGLPIAAALLARLPDRGAGFALPVALTALILPVYWVGHVAFGAPAIAAGVLVLGGGAVLALRRGPDLRLGRFAEALFVFTLAFLLLVAVRAVDPSIHPAGGEKFLDFGLLNSLLRAPQLPPEDMWFAGEPVSYYYGGHLLAAVLADLTATPARYAYNLALAGFYGALAAAAYGLAGSVAAARDLPYRPAGALGAFFVAFAGNLVTALQFALDALPRGFALALAEFVAGRSDLAAERLASLSSFSYWTASRVIRGTINEFPLFAWLNGDLHAHMMSTPFLLLAAAVAFAAYRTPEVGRRRLLVFGAAPPVAGLLAVVNTWSFPSAVGLAWLALALGEPDPAALLPAPIRERLDVAEPEHEVPGVERELARVGAATLSAIAVAALGVVWVLPFFLGTASGRAIGVFPDRSGLVEFLLVHGWLLAVFGGYLASRLSISTEHRDREILLVAVLIVVGLLMDAAALVVVLPLLIVAWIALRTDRSVGFETVLFVAGAGLVLLVEFIFVREQAGPGRMNTVFKTYMQVWALWATGAAAALVGLERGLPQGTRRTAVRVLGALVVVSGALYGGYALNAHFEDPGEATLDATTAAARNHPAEWEAIGWLDDRSGRPNIVTAPGCWCNRVDGVRPYDWVNAPSSFTGVPTVAGWSHEVGYRGREAYMRRVTDVETIYTGSPDERDAALDRYDVRYVYVGPNERALYGDVTFEGPKFEPVFRNEEVTIYEVAR